VINVSSRPSVSRRPVARSPRLALLLAGAVASAVTLAGCGSSSDKPAESNASSGSSSTSSAAADAGNACATVSAPLTVIDAKSPDEPKLSIPQPEGWERNTAQDSEIIRYVLVNKALAAESFAPNVVVTLEKVPSTDVSPESILEQQRSGLSQAGATDVQVDKTENCGSTAEIVNYRLPAMGSAPERPARVLLTAVPFGSNTWSATVTAQAVNADDPTYQRDLDTIFTGFQMTAPAGS
jgi:hypothetical protein